MRQRVCRCAVFRCLRPDGDTDYFAPRPQPKNPAPRPAPCPRLLILSAFADYRQSVIFFCRGAIKRGKVCAIKTGILRVASDFCLSVWIGVNETRLASAEDRALRGRNLTYGRLGGGAPAAGPALLPESVPKRKIHLSAILRAMKNFNSLIGLPHP